MLKAAVHDGDIILMNMYAPTNTSTTFMKQRRQRTQGNPVRNTLILGDALHYSQYKAEQVYTK